MKIYRFESLLQKDGWKTPAYVSVNKKGKIKSIESTYTGTEPVTVLKGYAFPGFQNAHSHSFQYAMIGLAEKHSTVETADDFWSWREAMYNLAQTITPEQLENIAAMLYAEMVRHGYTHVAEFHYLHNDLDGTRYTNPAEMGERLLRAAQKAGINITLVPMFYQKGGFGVEPSEKQKRFISSTFEEYIELLEATEKACAKYKGARMGLGVHSLRAVKKDDIIRLSEYNNLKKRPFHIHISEQLQEVEDCLLFYGKRPVEWLLENVKLNENYHLVHATHINEKELEGIVKAKANVVLCPSTEGNLGDGIFPLVKFQKSGGNWSIGTDSHIGLNPWEEIRWLDYEQRITLHKRNTFNDSTEGNSALFALKKVYFSGVKAMGRTRNNFFEIGKKLNACIISADAPILEVTTEENRANTILYSGDCTFQLATIVNGNLVSYKNTQKGRKKITQSFIKTMKELGNR